MWKELQNLLTMPVSNWAAELAFLLLEVDHSSGESIIFILSSNLTSFNRFKGITINFISKISSLSKIWCFPSEP